MNTKDYMLAQLEVMRQSLLHQARQASDEDDFMRESSLEAAAHDLADAQRRLTQLEWGNYCGRR